MAWVLQTEKEWYCYIHIPKTGGNWVRASLANLGPWVKRETMGWGPPGPHGMPDRWDYPMVFTVVRKPSDWLRSAWGSRMKDGWRPHPERVLWSTFCAIVDEYRSDDFETWCRGVLDGAPGIVGWLFGAYSPPPVKVLRLGPELDDFIARMGGNPTVPPENVDDTHDMEIPMSLIRDIYEVEYSAYVKYGFEEEGYEDWFA